MKSATLTPNITYVSLSDDDGEFGLLLNHFNGNVINAVEIHSREQFKSVYDGMVSLSTPEVA